MIWPLLPGGVLSFMAEMGQRKSEEGRKMFVDRFDERPNRMSRLALLSRGINRREISLWTRTGKAWVHEDGKGYNLQLIDGQQIVVRLDREKLKN